MILKSTEFSGMTLQVHELDVLGHNLILFFL